MPKPPRRDSPDADTVVPADRRGPSWAHREARYTYDVPVSFAHCGRLVHARVKDVWPGGAFVACDPPPPVDAVIAFDLPTPRGSVPIRARVVWIRMVGAPPEPGVGVKFEDLDRGVDAVLDELVARLRGKRRS